MYYKSEKNIGRLFFDINWSKIFFDPPPKVMKITTKMDKWNLIFLESFCMASLVQLLSHILLYNPMDCSVPSFPVCHQLLELAQTHVHRVGDAIQPSHPLSSPSPPAFNLSQHQCLFQWVGSWHLVAKIFEFKLQHQSLQWIFRTDFL